MSIHGDTFTKVSLSWFPMKPHLQPPHAVKVIPLLTMSIDEVKFRHVFYVLFASLLLVTLPLKEFFCSVHVFDYWNCSHNIKFVLGSCHHYNGSNSDQPGQCHKSVEISRIRTSHNISQLNKKNLKWRVTIVQLYLYLHLQPHEIKDIMIFQKFKILDEC